jgi:pyruvate/2-oxoglutarate dehydrogenase complex dihydrolipoamide dehydrogenase (E3) component
MAVEHFEFVVVGGGKAGKTLATKMASTGHQVAMIEEGMIGGSCINVACIPTKTLVNTAKIAEIVRRAAEFGIRVKHEDVDAVGIRRRTRKVVTEMVARNQANFDRSGMTLLIGTARFTGPHSVEVALKDGGTREVSGEKVFINTGTRPAFPPINGLDAAQPLDSTSIQELDHVPEHLVIIGGGYIGCEFAQIFRRFGSQVTLIERNEIFLSHEDADVVEHVLKIFQEDGIEVCLGASVEQIDGRSGQSVRVRLQMAHGEQVVKGTHLLAALGRTPNTDRLNLFAAGVAVDSQGYVQVNERLETTVPGVWALGDVNGGPQFTHASLDDYRIVSANLSGGNRTTTDRMMPYTMFIDPELGRVGLTEAEARRRGHNVRIARLPAAAIPRAVTTGETRGYLKAVVDAGNNQILGASILAESGGEVITVIQIAMQAGLPYTALRDMIIAHPTMAEGLNDLFAKLE